MSNNLLGITVSKADFGPWYQQVITKAEMIEYYDISGCYILRPWAYSMWEIIQSSLNSMLKKDGVSNAYFPLLVTKDRLTKEQNHIEGFSAEVAWLAKKQPDAPDLAIRPTSETIIYPAFAHWIKSHRDLPLRINQWCNIIRWEFKNPVPFIRSREFLWQEGHSAYASKEEADKEVTVILEFYRSIYEDLLAVPVIKGRKSNGEKFAGADYTTTVEIAIPTNGRAIQGTTSHSLGQNFSSMFNICYDNNGLIAGSTTDIVKPKENHVWQNSWGFTTRSIGIAIMIHGDDKGLVLPPKVAPIQVVIVPVLTNKKTTDKTMELIELCKTMATNLESRNIRAHCDDRINYQFGFKFNHWELKGVPIRIEVGLRELQSSNVIIYRRDTCSKQSVPVASIVDVVISLLDTIQDSMLAKAKAERDAYISKITTWAEFVPALNAKNLILCPWCGNDECEQAIVKQSGIESQAHNDEHFQLTSSAKSLCIPFEQPELAADTPCAGYNCQAMAKHWALFGRSY